MQWHCPWIVVTTPQVSSPHQHDDDDDRHHQVGILFNKIEIIIMLIFCWATTIIWEKNTKQFLHFLVVLQKIERKKVTREKKRVELHERLRQLHKVVGFSFLFSFSNSHTFFGVLSVNDVYLKSKLVKREKKESAIELKVVDMCVHVHCTWTSLNITEKKVERILHYKRTWNERGRENKEFFIHVQQEQWLRRMYYRSSLQRRVRYCYHQGKVNEGAKVKALL